MKKIQVLLTLTTVVFFLVVCGKKETTPRYAEGSKIYEFVKAVSDTFQIPEINPAKSNDLVRTKDFSVTNSDVMPGLYRILGQYASSLNMIPKADIVDLIKQLAKQEAEKRILLAEAKQKNISINPDSVQSRLENLFASYGGKDKFLDMITQQEFTLEMVEEDVKNSLIIQQYLDNFVYSAINVDEEEIQTSYREDKNATVQHILMLTQGKSDQEKKEIHQKMENLLKRARSGEDFGELAKQYSEDPGSKDKGGLYEKFTRGQMVKPFEDASFNLPIGSISDIVETQYGYHIIKVLGREKETRPLEEVRSELKTKLTNSKKSEAIIKHMDSLKEKYEYKEIF